MPNKAFLPAGAPRQRKPTCGAMIKDALVALWEALDRIWGKRPKVMILTLLPELERHGRLDQGKTDRTLVLDVSAATIDRLLIETKLAAAGGNRRRVGFYSAIRREVPIRTFNDWNDPAPGFCEVDMAAHGWTSAAGSFMQTLTMVDVATGWTECMPLVTRESGLVFEAMQRSLCLFRWIVLGADFDNDSAFIERCGGTVVPIGVDRSDALACPQEERSAVRRAEEWRSGRRHCALAGGRATHHRLVILDRLGERCPGQFGPPQYTTVQRQLKVLRRKAAGQVMVSSEPAPPTKSTIMGNGSNSRSARSVVPIANAPAIADAGLGNIVS